MQWNKLGSLLLSSMFILGCQSQSPVPIAALDELSAHLNPNSYKGYEVGTFDRGNEGTLVIFPGDSNQFVVVGYDQGDPESLQCEYGIGCAKKRSEIHALMSRMLDDGIIGVDTYEGILHFNTTLDSGRYRYVLAYCEGCSECDVANIYSNYHHEVFLLKDSWYYFTSKPERKYDIFP
jgi:hypothetical protein